MSEWSISNSVKTMILNALVDVGSWKLGGENWRGELGSDLVSLPVVTQVLKLTPIKTGRLAHSNIIALREHTLSY